MGARGWGNRKNTLGSGGQTQYMERLHGGKCPVLTIINVLKYLELKEHSRDRIWEKLILKDVLKPGHKEPSLPCLWHY